MFWKYNTPSAEIEALLKKEDVTLQELMDEDELLQECKIPNKKAIDFLTKPEIIEQLVSMMVNEPSDSIGLAQQFKNANLAAELLTCDGLIDKLVASANLLQHLYQFFHNEKPINPILSSFVCKVFATPIQRKHEQNWYSYQVNCFQILEFIKSKHDFVDIMINHVGTSAVMDFLSHLITGIEEDEQEIKYGIHQWLNSNHLVEKLVDKLSQESESEEHASVDSILCEIAYSKQRELKPNGSGSSQLPCKNILAATLESDRVINKMLDILLKENWSASSVKHVINIIVTLFSASISLVLARISMAINSTTLDIMASPGKDNILVVKTVIQRLAELHGMLLRPSKPGTLPTSFGIEMNRLGNTKLQVVKFVSALICTNYDKVHEEMASISILETLLNMVYKYPLNNFLHMEVTQAIMCILMYPLIKVDRLEDQTVVNSMDRQHEPFQVATLLQICRNATRQLEDQESLDVPYHPLLEQLFTECEIVQRLLADLSPREVHSTEQKNHNIKGYLGHFRTIANTIQCCRQSGENTQLIDKYIKELPNDLESDWEQFTVITLAEINLKNRIIPINTKRTFDSDSDDDFFVCAQPSTMIIINQDFKGSDMETNSFCDGKNFSIYDNNVGEGNIDLDDSEGSSNNYCLFEKMCCEKNPEMDDLWKFQEKEVKFPDMIVKENDNEEPQESSPDEVHNRFVRLKNFVEKNDFDDDAPTDWSEVFDNRGETTSNNNSEYNPWHEASARDTSDNSWANFEGERTTENASFFSLTKVESAVTVPPAAFEVDFHTAFASEKSPFRDVTEETHPVCDPKISSDDYMQNTQDSSSDASNN